MHGACMGHACISIIGTMSVPELAEHILYNYYMCCTSLAWASSSHHEPVNRVTHGSFYDRGHLMSV